MCVYVALQSAIKMEIHVYSSCDVAAGSEPESQSSSVHLLLLFFSD